MNTGIVTVLTGGKVNLFVSLLQDNTESAETLHGAITFHFITSFYDAGHWCVISTLVIDKATRGAGIGRQLLLETERYAIYAGWNRNAAKKEQRPLLL